MFPIPDTSEIVGQKLPVKEKDQTVYLSADVFLMVHRQQF